jgi:hypothetical protein
MGRMSLVKALERGARVAFAPSAKIGNLLAAGIPYPLCLTHIHLFTSLMAN